MGLTGNPIALLTDARLALDAASKQIADVQRAEVVAIWRRLGRITSDLIAARDDLDALLAMPGERSVFATPDMIERQEQKRERRKADLADHNAPRKRKPSPLDQYAIGQLVDVDNFGRPYVGRVIRKSTRLHVEHLDPEAAARGHMAYEQSDLRAGRVKPHSHVFALNGETGPAPYAADSCCIKCERSARELGIKL